ncbi:LOW QUALITY PROTEIN: QWRF motif-containing protein 7 [Actinidia eriantha]|uniref:LOW QUALITY PROTEIN: QWRF motif-containing protein 7 n=1 Tax=Actinidia eriantha TaxID=165200 RepID=UPI00258FEEC6|nr:LOW QUALITY PROTEIN: QWRF motif-containing protein 7 [Actinidia eriantha]
MPNHHKPAGPLPSACLSRSKSERPTSSPPQLQPSIPSPSPISAQRSKSTTKSRTKESTSMTSPRIPRTLQENRDQHFAKFWQQGQVAKRTRPGPSSLSAWALWKWAGRSSGGRGGVSGVLKYFRQRKGSPEKEELHRVRVLHSRLVQWRFVNARALANMTKVKVVAERKLFAVWLRITMLRNSILEKRMQAQRLQHEIKLHEIINPQISLLKEWAQLETKNSEAVGRVTRKLSAISIRLPLVQEAKGDELAVYNAMKAAVGVMENIETVATKLLPQVEMLCFLMTELIVMEKQHKECIGELETWISTVGIIRGKREKLKSASRPKSRVNRGRNTTKPNDMKE